MCGLSLLDFLKEHCGSLWFLIMVRKVLCVLFRVSRLLYEFVYLFVGGGLSLLDFSGSLWFLITVSQNVVCIVRVGRLLY